MEYRRALINLELTWGAGDWMGPLTLTEAGTALLSFHDPERRLDPAMPLRAYQVVPGRYMRVDVDGTPVWTGRVATIAHDLGAMVCGVQGTDAIPELAAWAVSIDLAAGLASDQATALMVGSRMA